MLVALLKYQHCSINETDDNGETVLHMACRGWNVECVRALIQNERCDSNIQIINGSTALVGSTYTVYQQQIVQVLNIVEALISSGKCRQEHNIHKFVDSTKPQLLSALQILVKVPCECITGNIPRPECYIFHNARARTVL